MIIEKDTFRYGDLYIVPETVRCDFDNTYHVCEDVEFSQDKEGRIIIEATQIKHSYLDKNNAVAFALGYTDSKRRTIRDLAK